jgi:dTMP kinase
VHDTDISFDRPPHGAWIALEGGEGSGKSTQLAVLQARYSNGHVDSAGVTRPVTFTREPGGTVLGQTLRHALLHTDGTVDDRTEALLMAADRAAHWHDVVAPALTAGHLVISDRSAWSSLAYQAHGRGLNRNDIHALSDFATNGHWPDLAIVLDVDAATSATRRAGRTSDRIELGGDHFLQRVTDGYWTEAATNPDKVVLIDANAPIDAVTAAIAALIDRTARAQHDADTVGVGSQH